MQSMVCKGYLHRGRKLDNMADGLMRVIKLSLFSILAPIHADPGQTKGNMSYQHYIYTAYEQEGSDCMKKYSVDQEL